jgi:hypothetical protein
MWPKRNEQYITISVGRRQSEHEESHVCTASLPNLQASFTEVWDVPVCHATRGTEGRTGSFYIQSHWSQVKKSKDEIRIRKHIYNPQPTIHEMFGIAFTNLVRQLMLLERCRWPRINRSHFVIIMIISWLWLTVIAILLYILVQFGDVFFGGPPPWSSGKPVLSLCVYCSSVWAKSIYCYKKQIPELLQDLPPNKTLQ